MSIYDRCSECNHALYFHAITSVYEEWRKWMYCEHCTKFTSCNELGEETSLHNSMPPKQILAREESVDDEGDKIVRF